MLSKTAETILKKRYLLRNAHGEVVETTDQLFRRVAKVNLKKCPECGQPIYNAEGCVICQSCGYSKCN